MTSLYLASPIPMIGIANFPIAEAACFLPFLSRYEDISKEPIAPMSI
ncbi:hypothetical protein [Flavobacterium sp. RS13.1]